MNSRSASIAAYDQYQKSRDTECFSFNRYCDIQRLIAQHSALVLRDDYIGGNRWLDHLERDLMAFWGKAEVREMRHGLYRSFLTDEGNPLPGLSDSELWPPELRRAIVKNPDGSYTAEAGALLESAEKNADKNFVRSHSRQVFAYGIAYHMTGNPDYFQMCRQGAYAMLKLIGEDGSMYTRQHLEDGAWINDVKTRTSQDLAYGMTGISFYYYLTHDEAVLEKVLKLKNYIFREYFHPGKQLFTWLPYRNGGKGQSVELVSHLDQLYAYMLWLTPSLPKAHKEQFLKDMEMIATIMIEHFYSEVHGTFWGASTSPGMLALGTDHTDFGHSVKAMWVIYQVGVWTQNTYLMNFAREKIHAILENAYDDRNGSWNRRILPDGSLDTDKEWWSLAELDQAAALLSIKDPSYLQYINRTYAFWFKNMVDVRNGEIWHVLEGDDLQPKRIFPKAHCWKNALHTFEHALFCHLASKQILGENIDLHYAFESLDDVAHQTVTPYLFKANIVGKCALAGPDGGEMRINDGYADRLNIRVTFDSLH